ncbi:MAG: hypothetical protein ACUVWJ_09705 [Spirochaetota bacterium]
MKRLKVGFVAGFMDGFSEYGLELFERYQKELNRMSETLGFEVFHFRKIVRTLKDAREVREELDSKEVDFLLLFHSAYILGDRVFELMKTKAYVGLWAIDEPREEGPMPLASFVNLSQNASIARNYFKGDPKKVKWFFGPIDGPFFKPRFEITLKALTAVKNLRNAKVAQIGKLADGHINHYNDYRDIYMQLGVEVSRDYEVEDIIAMADTLPSILVEEELKKVDARINPGKIDRKKIIDSVRMYLVIKKICEENEYKAVAFSCWPKLMPFKGMTGCLINALLNNDDIVAGCEADVLGTISMLVLKYLAGENTVLMDMPKFDIGDNSLMLWHCGTAPFDMANEKGVRIERHYFAKYTKDKNLKDLGPITDVIFRQDDITVFRITGEASSFYYFTGKIFDEGKKTFDGSRGWVKDLKFYDEPVKVLDLMNTFLVNGLPHHYPVVMKDVSAYIEEFAFWKGLKKIRKVPYRDYIYINEV